MASLLKRLFDTHDNYTKPRCTESGGMWDVSICVSLRCGKGEVCHADWGWYCFLFLRAKLLRGDAFMYGGVFLTGAGSEQQFCGLSWRQARKPGALLRLRISESIKACSPNMLLHLEWAALGKQFSRVWGCSLGGQGQIRSSGDSGLEVYPGKAMHYCFWPKNSIDESRGYLSLWPEKQKQRTLK